MSDTSFTGATINAAGLADWGLPANWSNGIPNSGTVTAIVTLAAASEFALEINSQESFSVGNIVLDSANTEIDVLGTLNAAGTFYLQAGEFALPLQRHPDRRRARRGGCTGLSLGDPRQRGRAWPAHVGRLFVAHHRRYAWPHRCERYRPWIPRPDCRCCSPERCDHAGARQRDDHHRRRR